ncbi:MAG: putative transcriptional regulator, partial [Ilumatobacteraceae bacterium]|nr:putative transcriptional regulator [Ilumatobacteraceae bacterium]MCU1389446.1 putative transcriptional regulator [Ilumatobacteraceae bacterium]
MTADHVGEDLRLYPVGVVADRLGVPTATLRSWNRRYGIGPADHHPGRHRLYTEADIAAVGRMHQMIEQGASARSAARAARTFHPSDSSALLAAVFALDGATAGLVVEQSLRERGVIDTWDSLLRPAIGALSTLQVEGADCLDVEHLLTRVATRALQQIPAPTTWSGSAKATVLACCDGEAHTLALEALAAALNQSGCATVMLGASVPAAAITTALARLPAVGAVVLWSQCPQTADVAGVRMLAATSEVAVMIAGPGWDGAALG